MTPEINAEWISGKTRRQAGSPMSLGINTRSALDLFWQDLDEYGDFDRFDGIISELDVSKVVDEIDRHRNFTGRRDWPVESMILAQFAIKVFQYNSVSGLLRELARNPTLMRRLGFPLLADRPGHRDECIDDPVANRYRVPSGSAMSRFQQTLNTVNVETGCVDEVYEALADRIRTLLPDFGQDIVMTEKPSSPTRPGTSSGTRK